MITFNYNGVELSAADFPKTLQGWVAFSIAFAGNTRCRDNEAAVELLMHEAQSIINQVEKGTAP